MTKQKGAEYDIQSIAGIIMGKEKRGLDATFERDLLKSWAKYPGYESAKGVLEKLPKPIS